jgi:hypothetical protein
MNDTLNDTLNRRREKRISFCWPLWFGYDLNGAFARGQMADLSCHGVSFTIKENQCPKPGDHVLTRFSYPHPGEDFQMSSYYNWSEVIRVDSFLPGIKRVAMRLKAALPEILSEKEEFQEHECLAETA